jgi:tetratricopeptide (TPR) repeat protein
MTDAGSPIMPWNHDRAIGDYSEAIRLDPTYFYAYVNRGNAYYNLKNYVWAISDYNEAIRWDSKNAVAYNNHGNVYRAQGKNAQAQTDFDKAK